MFESNDASMAVVCSPTSAQANISPSPAAIIVRHASSKSKFFLVYSTNNISPPSKMAKIVDTTCPDIDSVIDALSKLSIHDVPAPNNNYRDGVFTGTEHDNSKIFEGIVFPKYLATDTPNMLKLKKREHHYKLMLIQARYEARILADHQLVHDAVYHGRDITTVLTAERLARVAEYSEMGAEIVDDYECKRTDPEAYRHKLLARLLDLGPEQDEPEAEDSDLSIQ